MTDYKKALIHLAETTDDSETLVNILCTLTPSEVNDEGVQDMTREEVLEAIKASDLDGDSIGAGWCWHTISSDPFEGIVIKDTFEVESALNENHSDLFTSYHVSSGDTVKVIADEYHAWSDSFAACVAVYDAAGYQIYTCDQSEFRFEGGVKWSRSAANGLWYKIVE